LAVVVGVGVVLVCNYFLGSGLSSSGTANKKKTSKFSRAEPKKAKPASSDDDDEEEQILRGYKTTSDGKKTSYFNRELSAADKALLESNSSGPRLLSSATSASTTDSISSTTKTSGSSWNSAGTFEERNLTGWALSRCSALLRATQCTCDCGSGGSSDAVVRLTRANVTGDCIVATSRGKTKYIYDLQADCDWELSHQGSCINGKISVTEITAERQYEFLVATSSSSPKVSACVKSVDRGLQPALRASLDTLLSELQANDSGQ
jgi:hypothetical protein